MSAVQPIQIPQSETWITRAELAQLMGISLRTVDKYVADGMPSVLWSPRARRFRASVAVQWAAHRGHGGLQCVQE